MRRKRAPSMGTRDASVRPEIEFFASVLNRFQREAFHFGMTLSLRPPKLRPVLGREQGQQKKRRRHFQFSLWGSIIGDSSLLGKEAGTGIVTFPVAAHSTDRARMV